MSTVVALVAVFGWFWLVAVVNEHLKAHAARTALLGRRQRKEIRR